MQLSFKILNPLIGTKIPLPHYATQGAAGMDLRACISESIELAANTCQLIPTGIAIHLEDPKFAAMILPRSGLGHKHGIILGNTIGLIDSDYQGELQISCYNRSQKTYTIQSGERIAQLIVIPVMQVTLQVVDEFLESNRGEGGFGHTGKN
jgi:dUTP pyrophosphatase